MPVSSAEIVITPEEVTKVGPRESAEVHHIEQPENEFGVEPRPKLEVLKKVGTKNYDATDEVQYELDYISTTKGVEIDTPRTAVIQGIMDRMSEGTGIKTKVGILNKGTDIQAFAMPDGHI